MHSRAASKEKIEIIKQNLFAFLDANVPNPNFEAVDDVIVSYVVSAIDAVDNNPEDFYVHVNELAEIMSAYVADFSKIDRDTVYIWLMDIMGCLTAEKEEPYMDEAAKPDPKKDSLWFHVPVEEPASKDSSNASSRSNSTSEDDPKYAESSVRKITRKQMEDFESAVEASKKQAAAHPAGPETYQYTALNKFLTEMFPDASPMEIKHCVNIALGDIERALSTLIHRRENGLSLGSATLPARTNKHAAADSAQVKSRIIERYSYVDRESESREHKPLAPKHAPKKMVRYRDNKIVSLKGERYTEVSKGDEEGVKKSNKKHHP